MENIETKRRIHAEAIKTCSLIIAEKECEIDQLKRMHSQIYSSNEPATISSQNSLCFHQFEPNFCSSQLADLRSIGTTKRDDSKFISLVIKFMYNENLPCLKTKSVSGRSVKQGETKTQISPEKVTILKNIFSERIYGATDDDSERNERKKKLNRLIKDALHNISKRIDANEKEKEVAKRLKFDI